MNIKQRKIKFKPRIKLNHNIIYRYIIQLSPEGDNNNNNNLFIYSALFNMLGDQKRITTINNLKTINTNIRNIQIYLISNRY